MTTGEKLILLRHLKQFTQEGFCDDFNRRRASDIPAIARKQYASWEADIRNMQIVHLRGMVIYYKRFQVSADDLLFDEKIPNVLRNRKVRKINKFSYNM